MVKCIRNKLVIYNLSDSDIQDVDKLAYSKIIGAEVLLLIANHLICAKHCIQTQDDLYLTYQAVLDVVRMSTKLDKEETANRVLLNSVLPACLTDLVMKGLTRDEHQHHTMRKVCI